MNKQSNAYTIIYIIVLVIIVGAALAGTSMALRDRQNENANADKMRQILASVRIEPKNGDIATMFDKYIIRQEVIDDAGNTIEGNAFDIDMKDIVKVDPSKRSLPVFVCRLDDGSIKYILPAYGAGLWGPIWGYISIDADGSTIYGAYFAHQGETPGLGAEIEKPEFSNQFIGRQLFKDGKFYPIEVVKKGQNPTGNADYVDGVTGGTITSKGVGAMLDNCLSPYSKFLENLRNQNLKH